MPKRQNNPQKGTDMFDLAVYEDYYLLPEVQMMMELTPYEEDVLDELPAFKQALYGMHTTDSRAFNQQTIGI